MLKVRAIARLDIKGKNLVKGVQFEGLRKMGSPNEFATKYYQQNIDEILYIDIVASLYDRNSLKGIIKSTSQNVFVPITVGGGLRSVKDVQQVLRSGADKVAINTAAIHNPQIINHIAEKFGSQCMVMSIQAKKVGKDKWFAYYDNGREKTKIDVVEWALEGEKRGAGEILLMSVDREGTTEGFDNDLVRAVSDAVKIPVIAGGGMGCKDDFTNVVKIGHADAVCMAHVLHYNEFSIHDIKLHADQNGVSVRL